MEGTAVNLIWGFWCLWFLPPMFVWLSLATRRTSGGLLVAVFEANNRMKRLSIAKAGFVLSLMVLSFLYGFAARWHRWAPNAVLERASQKITALSSSWSPESTFLTSRVYDRAGAQLKAPQRMHPGLTVVTSAWEGEGGLKTEIRLLTGDGRTLHSWRIDREALFADTTLGLRGGNPNRRNVHGSHLLPNGDVLVNVNYIGTARLDACGRLKWISMEGNHHSITRAPNGSFWIPGSSQELSQTSPAHPNGFPGLDRGLYHEWLLHIAADGRLLERVNVLDVLYANGLERYLSKVSQPQAGTEGLRTNDVLHLNDVERLSSSMAGAFPRFEPGDLLVSLRNLHLVFVVDPETRVVKWHVSAPFIQQHDPDFLADGWIGVFDNNEDFTARGTMLGGSRIVAFRPGTDSMEVRFPTTRSAPFYTSTRGKWQQLGNDNMLLVESNAGRVVEVGPDGRTIWEWGHPPHNEKTVPVVTKAARHDLTRKEIASWPCSSVGPAPTPR